MSDYQTRVTELSTETSVTPSQSDGLTVDSLVEETSTNTERHDPYVNETTPLVPTVETPTLSRSRG